MNKKRLLIKLHWFYTLELNQVDLYMAQSKIFKNQDKKLGLFFERIALIEQNHVDNIAKKIRELGGNPTRLGDIVAPNLGKIAGNTMGLSGLKIALKANRLLESKAISDYELLIKDLEKDKSHGELIQLLQYNLIDEHLHTAWFEQELRFLNKERRKRRW